MWRNRITRLVCAFAALCIGIAIVPIRLRAARDLEQHLRDQYKGKTLLLRNFYDGSTLRYDASGQLLGPAAAGDWTVDGLVQVDDLRLSSHHLNIRGTRMRMGWIRDAGFSPVPSPAGKAGEDYRTAKEFRIEADFGSGGVTPDSVDVLLAKIFLTSQDYFPELVPDYWKPCVLAGLRGTALKQYSGCQFSPAFRAVPGVAIPSGSPADQGLDGPEQMESTGIFLVGRGVAPPRPILQPGPEFAEPARQAKYQGVVTLGLVVNKEGFPTKIHIVSPLGCGLDAKAVQAVETWRFKPAEKDGEPVAVEIAVEVDFHLY